MGLVVNAAELQALRAEGYEARVMAEATRGSIDPDYMDYGELLVRMQEIEADYPAIARLVNLNQELGSSLTGNVTCSFTGSPLSTATISVQEVVFLEGERRHPEPLFIRDTLLDLIVCIPEDPDAQLPATAYKRIPP